jgi:hypothetical protein
MVKVTGTIRTIKEVETFKNTDFTKQSIIVETFESKTPFKIDFNNDNKELLKDLLLGQYVLIEFNIRGNYDKEDKTKVYNSLEGKTIKTF